MKVFAMQPVKRPLSPHLQVYKLPLTAKFSILHRVTGAALSIGTLLVTAFFLAAASGEDSYNLVMGFAGSSFGQVILFLWSAALYFHMCNGVRHMIWDTGRCLSKVKSMRTNYMVLFFAFLCTAVTWLIIYAQLV